MFSNQSQRSRLPEKFTFTVMHVLTKQDKSMVRLSSIY